MSDPVGYGAGMGVIKPWELLSCLLGTTGAVFAMMRLARRR